MRTTLILDPEAKKLAQIKALQEGKTLSEVVNLMLKDYVQGEVYKTTPITAGRLSDKLNVADYNFGDRALDREFIYEELE